MRRGAVQGFIDDHCKELRPERPLDVMRSGMRIVHHSIYRNGVDSGYQITISFVPARRIIGYDIKLISENCALAMLRVSSRRTAVLGATGFMADPVWYYPWSLHCHQVPIAEIRGQRVTYRLTERTPVGRDMQVNYVSAMQFFLTEHNMRSEYIPEPPFREPQ